jgi:tRNA(fMet)-specific endonuclease VapC
MEFCAPLEILPFDSFAASVYGTTRAALEQAGTPIGPLDTLIAAHALALKAILVTNNQREFKRVPNLHVENWT